MISVGQHSHAHLARRETGRAGSTPVALGTGAFLRPSAGKSERGEDAAAYATVICGLHSTTEGCASHFVTLPQVFTLLCFL